MRSRLTRLALALAAFVLLQGCAELQGMRVATLRPENSSSNRSMLSYFNPLTSQQRSAAEGSLLRAPEDRGRSPFFFHP